MEMKDRTMQLINFRQTQKQDDGVAKNRLVYVNEKDITLEILHSIKRAGADMIVTYFAKSA